jgi:hypothetical protein
VEDVALDLNVTVTVMEERQTEEFLFSRQQQLALNPTANDAKEFTFCARILRLFLAWLINNSAMLQASQIEHANAAIGSARHENVNASGAESYIKDFLVVCDQLSLGRESGNVPDGAGSINATRDDELGRQCIPVERSQGCGMFGGFGI